MRKILQKKFVLLLIVVLALGLVVFKVKTEAPTAHQDVGYPVRAVEVMTLRKIPYRSHATGYGNVEPKVSIKAKSEVSGRIVYIHPRLRKGASLPKGTVVLRIEPTTFQFSLERSKAALRAQVSQSKSQVAQTEDTLGRTEIRLPIDTRIGEVFVEKGEFTAVGTVLFEALGTDAVEITAELPTRLFRPLLVD